MTFIIHVIFMKKLHITDARCLGLLQNKQLPLMKILLRQEFHAAWLKHQMKTFGKDYFVTFRKTFSSPGESNVLSFADVSVLVKKEQEDFSLLKVVICSRFLLSVLHSESWAP